MTNFKSQPKGIAPYPMIYIPGLTDFTLGYSSINQKHVCSGMEMDFQRCIARVGQLKHLELCSKESEDLVECLSHSKQRERYELMKAERKRKKEAPLPLPPFDSLGASTAT